MSPLNKINFTAWHLRGSPTRLSPIQGEVTSYRAVVWVLGGTQTFWIACGGVQTDRQTGQKLSRAQSSENAAFIGVKSLLKGRIFHMAFPHRNMGKREQSSYSRQVMCSLDEDAFQ